MDSPRRIILKIRQCIVPPLAAHPVYFWFTLSVYFNTFIILLPWICSDWPYSIYFSSSWKQEELAEMALSRNEERLQMADNYIARLDFAATLRNYEEMLNVDDVDIAIGVITVRRQYRKDDIGYLTQVMARMDEVFKRDTQFTRKALFICNVHAGPDKHREAEKLGLYFPVSTRFPKGDTASVIMENFEKEKQDYMYCLEEGMNYRPRYVMLVEDDALPRFDMLSVLKHTLDHNVEQNWHTGGYIDNHQKWAYFKLYYPEKWQGYSYEPRSVIEILAMSAVAGSVSLSALLLTGGRRSKKFSMRTRMLAFCVGAVYMIMFAQLVGRPYMLKFRKLSPDFYNIIPAPACCSPSILYPSHVIPDILDYLHNVKCRHDNPVDLAIDKFAVNSQYKKYLIEPSLFMHIGYISTLKGPSRSPELFIH